MTKNVLICGLGGGLDVLNCLPLYYKLKNDRNYNLVQLGSIRPAPISSLMKIKITFHKQGAIVLPSTVIDYKGRYAEPFISEVIGLPIAFFSRSDGVNYNVEGLSSAIKKFRDENSIDEIFFVDGGGDSMTLEPEDIIGASESKNVFGGGDAFALKALQNIPSTLCVTAVGLDVNLDRFIKRLSELTLYDIYLGSQNIREFPGIEKYIEAADKILYRKEGDEKSGKYKSHTGSVLYCSITKNWGIKRTYVSWEGDVDGKKGVMVRPDHAMMYMFKADKIHQLKNAYKEREKQKSIIKKMKESLK